MRNQIVEIDSRYKYFFTIGTDAPDSDTVETAVMAAAIDLGLDESNVAVICQPGGNITDEIPPAPIPRSGGHYLLFIRLAGSNDGQGLDERETAALANKRKEAFCKIHDLEPEQCRAVVYVGSYVEIEKTRRPDVQVVW